MATATIHLDLTTTFILNGQNPEELAENIRQAVFCEVGNKTLSGYTKAKVDEFSLNVIVSPDNKRQMIENYLHHLIENGHIQPEKIVQHMANFGLMSTSEFIKEMANAFPE